MSPYLFAGLFAAWAALMAAYPVFPPIARQLGLTEIETGILISLSALLMMLVSPFWGGLSERWGRKSVFLIGIFGAAGSILAFAVALHLGLAGVVTGGWLFALLILTRMPLGLLIAAAPVAAQAYVADTTDAEHRAAGMSKIGAANALGLIAGPAVAAALVTFGLLVPFYAGAAFVVVVAIAVLVAMPDTPQRAKAGGKTQLRPWDGRVWPFLMVGFVSVMLVSTVQVSIGFFLIDRFALSVAESAQAGAVAFLLVGVALAVVQGALIPKLGWPPARLLRIGLPVMAAGLALLVAAPDVWGVHVAFVVTGVGAGMTFPGFQAAVTMAVGEHEQGAVAGLSGATNAGGAVIGPVVGTLLYQIAPGLPYLGGAMILTLLAGFVWLNGTVAAAVPRKGKAPG